MQDNRLPRMAAVIDVGSNSVRYMEAVPAGGPAFFKQLRTTRLAEGLDQTDRLSDASMARSLAAIGEFAAMAREKGLPLYAYATSAVRDALNGPDFVALVQEKCGVTLAVLSGGEEARMAYLGALGEAGGGLMDVGGGSAQIMTPGFQMSWPIGCVRASEAAAGLDLPEARARLARWMDARGVFAGPAFVSPARWVGVGGTITTLAAFSLDLTAYDPLAIARAAFTPESLWALIDRIWAMGPAREAHPILRPRHDVICCGAMVAAELMKRFGIAELFVSDADGMEGFLLMQNA